MKAFQLNFLVWRGGGGGGKWGLLVDSFQRFLGEKPRGLHEIIVCGGFRAVKLGGEKNFFLSLFIYLFIICLFIACLCIYFLITLKKQLRGLAP